MPIYNSYYIFTFLCRQKRKEVVKKFFSRWSQNIEDSNTIGGNILLSVFYIMFSILSQENFKFDIYFTIDYLKALLLWILILNPLLYRFPWRENLNDSSENTTEIKKENPQNEKETK